VVRLQAQSQGGTPVGVAYARLCGGVKRKSIQWLAPNTKTALLFFYIFLY